MLNYYTNECSEVAFSVLIEETLINVTRREDEAIEFETATGTYLLHHIQGCCESVTIESIEGDLKDLINSPILLAEECTKVSDPPDILDDHQTWTFYRLGTAKGYVSIRFHGTSNGYYSERVSFHYFPLRG
jgi:hypothetical protein